MPANASRVLVLLHAFPVGQAMWRAQLDAAPGWRVVTPSLPGFDGRPLVDRPGMATYATAVLDTLEGLNIQQAVFGGLSMGGYVLFEILRQAPTRVSGLLLADTRTSADNPERRAARLRSRDLARRDGPPAIADEMIPAILGETTRTSRPEVVAQVRAMIETQTAEAIAQGLEAMMDRPDSAATLSGVTVPTAIVVGEEDTITPVADGEAMQRLVPGSTLVRIPRAGHMANLEAPRAFNDAMQAFLAGLSR
jgi:pimeloyl-ACP methyl ester carboxylesterase